MGISLHECLGKTYSRWARNHKSEAKFAAKANGYVLSLAWALLSNFDPAALEAIKANAKREMRVTDAHVSIIEQQARLISEQAAGMESRLKQPMRGQNIKPTTYVTIDELDQFYGMGATDPVVWENDSGRWQEHLRYEGKEYDEWQAFVTRRGIGPRLQG